MTDTPTDITLHRKSATLGVAFADGMVYNLPLEYLRVFSPSAEVRGHGGPMQLVTGKRHIGVEQIEPVGNYAIQLHFDDGHNTGIYSWETLRELGAEYQKNWAKYLERLEQEGGSRDG
jgi:DUF971 family protein